MPPSQSPSRRAVEAAVTAFEVAWQTVGRPVIEEFVPDGPTSRDALLEMIHIDLEYRLKAGDPARAEEYFLRYPEVAADTAVRRELVSAEFRFRKRREPELRRTHFAARYPAEWHSLPPDSATATATATANRPVVPAACGGPSIPGYRVLGVLGEGGAGVVYLARDEGLHRDVAVKVLRAGFHATTEHRGRFRTEAEALARLGHDHIVRVFSAGESGGLPYFVMEYLSGGTLRDRLGGTPQPPRQSAGWAAELADAVAEAHARGVLHRDLKPTNVLVSPEGRLKVSDFGLAQLAGGSAHLTPTDAVLGTPSYMAPEQAGGRAKGVGPAADVYALGAVLYECLTGRPPFRGESYAETVHQVIATEAVPPRRLVPSVPPDLETVCLKCLEKDPARRYASASALADDLRRFLDGRPVVARPIGPVGRAWRWARRHPTAAAAAALTAVLVVGVLGGSIAFARQAHIHAGQLAAERDRVRETLTRTERLLGQMSDSDAATQAVLYEFVVDETFPGFQHATDPADVRKRLPALEERARRRFAGHPLLEAAALTWLANGYTELARVSASSDDDREAERLYDEALSHAAAGGRGPDHPFALRGRNNLVVHRLSRSKATPELVRQARECHADAVAVLGPEHSLAITCQGNVGFALLMANQNATAEQVLHESLAASRRALGPGDPQQYDIRFNLGRAVAGQHGASAASADRQALWQDARTQFGLGSRQAVQSAREFAVGEIERGRAAEALTPLREVVAADAANKHTPPAQQAEDLVWLGVALIDSAAPAEAEPLLAAAVGTYRKVLGEDDWVTGDAEVAWGACQAALGRFAEADRLIADGFRKVTAAGPAVDPKWVIDAWKRAERAYRQAGGDKLDAFLKQYPPPK